MGAKEGNLFGLPPCLVAECNEETNNERGGEATPIEN
jgi:hypothetical protein